MDIVFIKQLAVDTVIGVYDWEKQIKQRLLLDLELGCDLTRAGRSDELRHTLDYAVISERVIALITAQQLELIESVAERVAQLLLTEFATAEVKVTVYKPGAVPAAQTVGVCIQRSREALS